MDGDIIMPLLSMIIVQLGYAILNILSKVAMSSGMNPFVQVAYRQIVGSATLVPFAYIMERKIRPKMTGKTLFQIFLCSLLGISVTQITINVGLKYATPTIVTALMSTNPAITFILALLFRLEKLRLKSEVGLAKAMGTAICVGGALILILYHGPKLGLGSSPVHWRYAQRAGKSKPNVQSSILMPSTDVCNGNKMKGETFMPLLSMIIVQLGYAIMDILTKLSMDSGMNPFVHVAYRQIFATATLVPFAYFMERKTRPKMTGKIFFHIFICSMLGIPLTQITYYVGLKYVTPTIATALFNTSPAITFIMAILFRFERLGLKSEVGLAKALGIVICVGGALLLTLYHGPLLGLAPSPIHWRYAQRLGANRSNFNKHVNLLMGPLMVIISSTAYSLWLILQTTVNQTYKAPYSSQALMTVMGSVQCISVALCVSHRASDWSLAITVRLVSVLHSGIISSALAYSLMSWCVNKKGPVYVAVFSPLPLIFVAIFSWGLLEEKWYLGKVLGSVLIVLGLYGVIWGTQRDNSKDDAQVESTTK